MLMSKIVVLAEKPSVGRDIARVLNCHKKGNGYLEGGKYIVTWALGHLVTIADPEAYDDKYKSWRLEDLPMLPQTMKLVVIKQTGKQFQAVKTQLLRKDVSEIIIATDAGREGELVARWIIEKAGIKKPIKRLWISSVTDKAIKEGFAKCRDGRAYENLFASAVARAESDWLVGMNATRALTTKYNAQLSCGRVQTPTLAMIAHRVNEIKQFTPTQYFGITALTENIKLTYVDKHNNSRIYNSETIKEIIKKIKNQKAVITEIQKTPKKTYAPQLYDLTELQRDAHNAFGFTAKETLSTLQKLYEQHKVVTYPRTDSRYISSDMVDTLKDRVEACASPAYRAFTATILKGPIKVSKHFVDDQKVSDHHAIIPTEQRVNLNALSNKELKLYDLILKRFLAVLYPAYQYEQTVIKASIAQYQFTAKGKRVLQLGWKEIYGHDVEGDEQDAEVQEQILPELKVNDQLFVKQLMETTGQTKPPKPFTEATLLSAMENPQRFLVHTDQELSKTLQQTGGLGTVATRADIIEKLFSSFLIEKRGKDIFITSKGKQLLELVPEDLKSPALTGAWEQKLDAIAKGNLKKESFIQEIKGYAKSIVSEIKQSEEKFKHDNISGTKCPECQKPMLEVKSKKGKLLVCQDRECGHRKNVSKVTNARCPQCRKKLELHGQGDGQIFVCVCGYREKLASFNERRGKEKNQKLSKKEVAKFLNKQNEEPLNTALADALAKLKLKDK